MKPQRQKPGYGNGRKTNYVLPPFPQPLRLLTNYEKKQRPKNNYDRLHKILDATDRHGGYAASVSHQAPVLDLLRVSGGDAQQRGLLLRPGAVAPQPPAGGDARLESKLQPAAETNFQAGGADGQSPRAIQTLL